MMWYDRYLKYEPTSIGIDHIAWCYEKSSCLHREYGPAIIWSDGKEHWWINKNPPRMGKNITVDVNEWIKKHNYPSWEEWDDAIKIHFKMSFL